MNTLRAVEPDHATGPVADLLAAVKRRLGAVPNMTKVMANSPALLHGYLELAGALSGGVLGLATGERLALAIAQDNRCSYCLSAHSYLAEHLAHSTKPTSRLHATPTPPIARPLRCSLSPWR